MACQYISWPKVFVEICRVGLFRTFAFPDKYQVEKKGVMTRDGERGAVWSINTLAPYMLVSELDTTWLPAIQIALLLCTCASEEL
jgi:hypothetical protein